MEKDTFELAQDLQISINEYVKIKKVLLDENTIVFRPKDDDELIITLESYVKPSNTVGLHNILKLKTIIHQNINKSLLEFVDKELNRLQTRFDKL